MQQAKKKNDCEKWRKGKRQIDRQTERNRYREWASGRERERNRPTK